MRLSALLCLTLLSLNACTGADVGPNGEPAWVTRGSGSVMEDGKRLFYGVGMVTGVGNRALARTTAENRARAEIGKVFKTYSASMMRDYMASTAGGTMDASAEEQHIDQTIKTFSAVTLNGVVIVDHWVGDDGTVYALAQLDLSAFEGALDQMKELDAKTRDFIRANAEKAFDKLEAEENRSH